MTHHHQRDGRPGERGGAIPDAAIELVGLSKHYGSVTAVADLSLRVPAGAVYGLLGPNGAGKTTTFRVLCGYLRPSAGGVRLLGLAPGDERLGHGRVAALPQDALLPPAHSVRSFLRYMAELQHLDGAAAAAEVARVLEIVELGAEAERPTRSLSHGMARRVALAQCFLGAPELILLDEPTSGLDPRHAHQIRALVKRLAGTATVVFASHNLAEVQELCSHVAIVDRGRLVAAGSTAEICRATHTLRVEVGATRLDHQGLGRMLGLACRWEADAQLLTVELPAERKAELDRVTSQVLSWLIEQGHPVRGLRRGESLEQRYLELT